MIGCAFRFALDCNLALPNDILFRINVDNKSAFCRFNSKKANKILTFNFDDYRWLDKSILEKREYNIKRIMGERVDGTKVPIRYFYSKKNGDAFSGGVKDDITYSLCEVLFNIKTTDYINDQRKLDELQKWVLNVIVEFCDVYRLITSEMTFTRSCIYDSPIVEVLISDDPIKFDSPNGILQFKSHLESLSWNDPNITGHEKIEVPKELILRIHEFLEKGEKLEVYHRLILDAKEQAILRNNHDLSVVLIENAFEVFLQSWLISLCEKNNVLQLPIGKKKDIKKDYQEAILNGNVREDLLHNYVKILTGKNPAGSSLYNKWFECAYRLRNDIVHKGKYETTSEQSYSAYKATMNFIVYLEKLTK